MDGNGRWAKKRHLPRIAGHKQGMETVKNITKVASNLGVKVLTLYAFLQKIGNVLIKKWIFLWIYRSSFSILLFLN